MKKRNQLIINRKFQWQFIGALLIVQFVVATFTWIVAQESVARSFDMEDHDNAVWRLMFFCCVVLLVVMNGALVYSGLRYSLRISGPLYRIRKTLEALAQGQFPKPTNFRRGDFHPELADLLNHMIARLRQSSESDAAQWRDHAKQLREIQTRSNPQVAAALGPLISQADERARERSPETAVSNPAVEVPNI